MKLINSLNSRQVKRMQNIKLLQQKKIASDYDKINTIKVKSASVLKKKYWKRFFPVKEVLFRRGCKKDYEHCGSFQEAICPVLILAQVFALLPVRGVTAKSAYQLSFSWLYLRTIYSLVIVICFGFCSGFAITYALSGRLNFDEAETIIFHTSVFFIAMAFFNLSRKWPKLLVHWEDVERRLPTLKTEQQKGWLAQRIKMITLVATMCSLVEHLLSMLSLIYYANNCPAIPNNPIESYLFSNFIQVFHFIKYTTLAGIIGKVLNVLATFAWNFNDIFVMSVSVALAARFRQLNDYMLKAVKKPTTEQFWIQNRENYRNLCKLCEAVDAAISTLTLLCFSNNLYFICSKILKSLQKKPSFSHTVYFWFSLGYLLGRTLILSLYTSDINEEAKRPVTIFRGISRENWCCELKRFSDEVSTDVVALSGMKFFHLTRSSVLTVAGTIVTYELVLLQFNKADKINDCFED